MDLDIVLLPPKQLSEKIGKSVRNLNKKFKFKVPVDNKKLLPHISLLHIRTLSKQIPLIVKAVENLSSTTRPLSLRFTNSIYRHDFFVHNIAGTKALRSLHKKVVENAHPFKTGIIVKESALSRNKSLNKIYARKYGAANVLKNFSPHITLAIVKNPSILPDIMAQLPKIKNPKFITNRLAVTKVNSRHQVFKIVKEFTLKQV